jgi:uncharacterized coiled-coil protein SlyX
MSEVKKPKASDRLAALESAFAKQEELLNNTARRVGELEMINFNTARENEVLKDALQLLYEKLEAVVSLTNSGLALTDDNINEAVVKLKEQSLKEKVDLMVENNQIEATDVVGEDSLIVSRELTKEGEVENPRLQFLVGRLIPELKDKFLDKKVGDLVEGEENKLDIEIMEIYNFVQQPLFSETNQEENNETEGE